MWPRLWAVVKTAIFTFFVPGTVAGYVPYRMTRGAVARWPTDAIGFIALVPLAFGLALYLQCAWNFAVVGLGTPAPIDPPKTLVVRGPYRWTRNPMYVAVTALLAGEALLVRSLALAEYAVAVFGCFYLFVLAYEEPALRAKFGAAYDEYCSRVPRWISAVPRTWTSAASRR